MRRHIDSADFVVTGLAALGLFIFFTVAFLLLFSLGPTPFNPVLGALVVGGSVGAIASLGGTLIILGHAIYDWYIYDSWRRK